MHQVQKRILQAIVDIRGASATQATSDDEIAEKLSLDRQEIRDHLDLMEEEGYVKLARTNGPLYGAWLTSRGRVLLREPDFEKREGSLPVVNILNVIDSQIQNLAQTGSGGVVNQGVDSHVSEDISRVISQMVEIVCSSDDIAVEIKRDYSLEAEQLKTELQKSRPKLSRIREAISFLGDTEGTLGLAARVAPLLVALAPLVQQYLQSVR